MAQTKLVLCSCACRRERRNAGIFSVSSAPATGQSPNFILRTGDILSTVRTTDDRKQTTLWTISSGGQDTETVHGTQKPVEMHASADAQQHRHWAGSLRPFLGSGTSLIAAETTGRVCYAMEIDPRYVDVAVRRWQAFAGRVATHAGDGQSFEDIATMRAAQRTDSTTSRDAHEPHDIAPGPTQTEPVEPDTKSTRP